MAVFCDFLQCSLTDTEQHLRAAYCLHHLVMTASEMSVNNYHPTWCNIPEDRPLQAHHHENLKSYKICDVFKLLYMLCVLRPVHTCMLKLYS